LLMGLLMKVPLLRLKLLWCRKCVLLLGIQEGFVTGRDKLLKLKT